MNVHMFADRCVIMKDFARTHNHSDMSLPHFPPIFLTFAGASPAKNKYALNNAQRQPYTYLSDVPA